MMNAHRPTDDSAQIIMTGLLAAALLAAASFALLPLTHYAATLIGAA